MSLTLLALLGGMVFASQAVSTPARERRRILRELARHRRGRAPLAPWRVARLRMKLRELDLHEALARVDGRQVHRWAHKLQGLTTGRHPEHLRYLPLAWRMLDRALFGMAPERPLPLPVPRPPAEGGGDG